MTTDRPSLQRGMCTALDGLVEALVCFTGTMPPGDAGELIPGSFNSASDGHADSTPDIKGWLADCENINSGAAILVALIRVVSGMFELDKPEGEVEKDLAVFRRVMDAFAQKDTR